jgi:hypothetical protein
VEGAAVARAATADLAGDDEAKGTSSSLEEKLSTTGFLRFRAPDVEDGFLPRVV